MLGRRSHPSLPRRGPPAYLAVQGGRRGWPRAATAVLTFFQRLAATDTLNT